MGFAGPLGPPELTVMSSKSASRAEGVRVGTWLGLRTVGARGSGEGSGPKERGCSPGAAQLPSPMVRHSHFCPLLTHLDPND